MRIILASQSPRRKEIMNQAKFDYEVLVSNADETFEDGLTIEEQSKRLAYIKAKTIFDNTQGNRSVIGSDSMVVMENKVYEKPKDRDTAIKMLTELQGKKNTVYTSLAVLIEDKEEYKEIIELTKSDVYIKPMTIEEIEEYVDNDNPYDKAGAYAIQTSFCKHIDKISGDYFSIVGLPIGKVYDILKNNNCI